MKIDQIFAKLKSFEKQPSDAAWDKLNARLPKPERKIAPLWWNYAAAASILLLFFAGFWWLAPQNPEVGVPAITQIKDSSQEKNTSIESLSHQNERTKKELATKLNEKENEINQNKKLEKSIVVAHFDRVKKTKNMIQKVEKMVQSIEPKNELIAQESPQKPEIEQPIITEIAIKEALKTPEVVAQTESKAPEQTFVVNIAEEEPSQATETELQNPEKKRKFKLFGFFKQLKNIATGQKVNWNETGVNPTRLIARADASLERGRERIRK